MAMYVLMNKDGELGHEDSKKGMITYIKNSIFTEEDLRTVKVLEVDQSCKSPMGQKFTGKEFSIDDFVVNFP